MVTKDVLRKKAKEVRSLLDMDKLSEIIVEQIRSAEIYKLSQHIMIFYPTKREINLLPLLQDMKQFYLPKINGEDLDVCPYKEGDGLITSVFKTQEPLTEPINPEILDMIFVPTLLVDKKFHRLGYGKGFYDRFLLKNARQAIKIVPIPSCLVVDELPADEFDAQFDMILDEL